MYIYIYIYIEREREREKERKGDRHRSKQTPGDRKRQREVAEAETKREAKQQHSVETEPARDEGDRYKGIDKQTDCSKQRQTHAAASPVSFALGIVLDFGEGSLSQLRAATETEEEFLQILLSIQSVPCCCCCCCCCCICCCCCCCCCCWWCCCWLWCFGQRKRQRFKCCCFCCWFCCC